MNLHNIIDVLELMDIAVMEPTEIRKKRDDAKPMAGQLTVLKQDAARVGEVLNDLARVVDIAVSPAYDGYQFTFLLNRKGV